MVTLITPMTPSNPHPQPSIHKPLDVQAPRPTTLSTHNNNKIFFIPSDGNQIAITARKWKGNVRQAGIPSSINQIFLLQVGLIYIGTLQVSEVPTFKISSHVPGTSSHHAYGTHCRLLTQLYINSI